MGDTSETPSVKEISGIIPMFFYDVIGRIMPGTVLIIGLILFLRNDVLEHSRQALHNTFPSDSSAGYVLAITLMFFATAHVLGVCLGSVSFVLVEKWLWRKIWPLDKVAMGEFMGATGAEVLARRFRAHFGADLPGDRLNEASFLCSYYVWTRDPNLGLITARADAELLAAQSLVLVVFGFLLMGLVGCCVNGLSASHFGAWSLIMLLGLMGNILSFDHMRKKRVFERFRLFVAVTSDEVSLSPLLMSRKDATNSGT